MYRDDLYSFGYIPSDYVDMSVSWRWSLCFFPHQVLICFWWFY